MTIEELRAKLEVATRERDEARGDLAFILAEYANERNEELTEDALCLKIAGLTHQRDEARAEVERLYKANAKWIAGWVRTGIEPNDVPHHESYRRGAEAMREACATMVLTSMSWQTRPDERTADEIAESVRALPIPGEP